MRKIPRTARHGCQPLSNEVRGLLDQIARAGRSAAECRLRATPIACVAREPGRESLLAALGQAVLREAIARAAEDRPRAAGLHGANRPGTAGLHDHRWRQAPLTPREEGE